MVRTCLLLLGLLGPAVAFADDAPSVVLVSTEAVKVYQADGSVRTLSARDEASWHRTGSEMIPLMQHPDRKRVLAAYLANFLDCERQSPEEKRLATKWTEQELRSNAKDEAWLRRLNYVDTGGGVVVVSVDSGRGAVALSSETLLRVPGSPCGAVVGFARRSIKHPRIAIAFNDDSRVRLWELNGNVFWTASVDSFSVVRILDGSDEKPIDSRLKNGRSALDVMTSDQGAWWILSEEHRGSWAKPKNWIAAIGGHAERLSTLSAGRYSSTGQPLQSWVVASDVHLVSATLVRLAD